MARLITIGNDGTSYSLSSGVITITGLAKDIAITDVAYLFNVTTDTLYHAPSVGFVDSTISVTATTITPTTAPSDTDDLHIQVWADTAGYDSDQDIIKTIDQAKALLAPSSILNNISETNNAANTYFYEIFPSDYHAYHLLGFHLTDSTSLGVKLYETMDESAAVPATGGSPSTAWEDVSTAYLGAASLTGTTINVKKKIERPNRLLLEVAFGSATNTIDIFEQQRN